MSSVFPILILGFPIPTFSTVGQLLPLLAFIAVGTFGMLKNYKTNPGNRIDIHFQLTSKTLQWYESRTNLALL